jgi:hypothetical protein
MKKHTMSMMVFLLGVEKEEQRPTVAGVLFRLTGSNRYGDATGVAGGEKKEEEEKKEEKKNE